MTPDIKAIEIAVSKIEDELFGLGSDDPTDKRILGLALIIRDLVNELDRLKRQFYELDNLLSDMIKRGMQDE